MRIELFDHDTITGENILLVMNLLKNIIAINLSNWLFCTRNHSNYFDQ